MTLSNLIGGGSNGGQEPPVGSSFYSDVAAPLQSEVTAPAASTPTAVAEPKSAVAEKPKPIIQGERFFCVFCL